MKKLLARCVRLQLSHANLSHSAYLHACFAEAECSGKLWWWYLFQLEAHKKGGNKKTLNGLQGLVLVQVGEMLYTANTTGYSEAILCR